MAPFRYRRHRFPAEIIQHAIWLYLRFTLSYRDVEELLAERGLDISYETVRRWVLKFGPANSRDILFCHYRLAYGPLPARLTDQFLSGDRGLDSRPHRDTPPAGTPGSRLREVAEATGRMPGTRTP